MPERPADNESAPHAASATLEGFAGSGMFRLNLYATIVFTVAAVAATIFPRPLRVPFVALSCVLFGFGTLAFLWAYGKAIERSREQDISIPMIYGMSAAPKAVRIRFHLLTFAQSTVAIATAAIRPFTAQAFGILAPMLGLGLAGLWAARYGTFAERKDGRYKARQANLAAERAREPRTNG